jgi:hypothetical protein
MAIGLFSIAQREGIPPGFQKFILFTLVIPSNARDPGYCRHWHR